MASRERWKVRPDECLQLCPNAEEAASIVGNFFSLLRREEIATEATELARLDHEADRYLERLKLATRRAKIDG